MQKLHPKAVWMFFFGYLTKQVFFVPFLMFWGAGMLSALANREGFPLTLKLKGFIFWAVLILLGFLILDYIWARLSYHFWRYELTEIAYKAERGIIWKRYISIPYERIQNVDIHRGIIARLLGLSDIQIQTAGYGAVGARGVGSEGRLPGLSKEKAEEIREELIKRAKGTKQGL